MSSGWVLLGGAVFAAAGGLAGSAEPYVYAIAAIAVAVHAAGRLWLRR